MTPLPLADLKLLAFEQFGAGPFGTMNLADLGVEVIRSESSPSAGDEPPGDITHHTGGYPLGENNSQNFQSVNRSKRGITLDLRKPEGRAALQRLVAGVDAVLNNLRRDLPAWLGLDYPALSQAKPSIVRERATWPAYDYLAQAEAGFCALTGEPGSTPARAGILNRDALVAVLDPLMRMKTSAEWVAMLAGKVTVTPVLTLAKALHNLYLRSRGGVMNLEHPLRPDLKVVASAVLLDGARITGRPGPAYGGDTASVLAEAGFAEDDIAHLRALGAV